MTSLILPGNLPAGCLKEFLYNLQQEILEHCNYQVISSMIMVEVFQDTISVIPPDICWLALARIDPIVSMRFPIDSYRNFTMKIQQGSFLSFWRILFRDFSRKTYKNSWPSFSSYFSWNFRMNYFLQELIHIYPGIAAVHSKCNPTMLPNNFSINFSCNILLNISKYYLKFHTK